jgi:TetR/AcrR family transcriptional regulator, transcriptional repressor for nem operon
MSENPKIPASRKQALTGIAVDMMQMRGFSALSLRDLAQQACIQAASLYSHFDSKNTLAHQAMAMYAQRQRDDLEAIAQNESSGSRRLHRYLDMFAATFGSEERLCLGLMLVVERNSVPDEIVGQIRKFTEQNHAWLEAAWDLGRTDQTIQCSMAGNVAAPIIFGAAEGMMAFALLEPDPVPIFTARLSDLLGALGVQPYART